MSDNSSNSSSRPRVSPSEFMRQLRPGNYSDTTERDSYVLDRPTLDHHLETVTARNQTHEFEIFCRKLCERTICPNLRPQTGPEGGGDGKADSETLPVANEIASLTYVGVANQGSEKWAFAFSAMKDWRAKAKKDVQGIVDAARGYKRIFFVTSRYAKAKARADLEQELTKRHGVEVIILDRSWILEEVIDKERKDLAFNYLHVGQEIANAFRLGPSDYSRSGQLESIEKALADPEQYAGMETQCVTDALLAAKLSRALERPRHETDGRFQRAVRLADMYGTRRQQLEARYEHLWTGVWWFDDHEEVNCEYEAFEARVIASDSAKDLEFVSNLLQTLYNGVVHGHFTQEDCQLQARAERLYARLDDLIKDEKRPNNALEARTLRLIGRLNLAMLDKDGEHLSMLWPEFEQIFADARGLGEYDPGSLIRMVEAAGSFAGNDPAYNSLVEKMAAFVSARTSEAQGALVLLRRAKQLDFDDRFDMIRWLGRAVRQLAKREYAPHLIEAAQHLALAYRSAGLLWAARATCVFAAASIVMDGEEDSEIDVGIVPTLVVLGWVTLELRHIPDFCNVVQVLNGCLKGLPLDDSSKDRLCRRLQDFDMALGSTLLNCTAEELTQLESLPDILDALGLFTARASLLYALGYADELRAEGSIPPGETDEGAAEMFAKLASQPIADDVRGPLVLNAGDRQSLQTLVMGIEVNVTFDGNVVSTVLAEACLAAIEACFATALELEIAPHTERFDIQIIEDTEAETPRFAVDQPNMRAVLNWPKDRMSTDYSSSSSTLQLLNEMALTTLGATCMVPGGEKTARRLVDEEAVFDRISVMAVAGNSYHRLFSRYVSSLANFPISRRYTVRRDRPTITRTSASDDESGSDDEEHPVRAVRKRPEFNNHREVELRSIINYSLWNKAGWKGALYASYGPDAPPVMGLIFGGDVEAARAIFAGWRDRFGKYDRDNEIHLAIIQNVQPDRPAHYNILITSKPKPEASLRPGGVMVLSRIHRMEPETDENLRRFLPDYKRVGAYILMPAFWNSGDPKLMPELAIVKYGLVVRSADDIRPSEIEYCALGAVDEARTGT